MIPMPPCCASAIASRDSVTVSMAALTIGTFSSMRLVSRVLVLNFGGQDVRFQRNDQDVVERVSVSGNLLYHSNSHPMTFFVFLSAAARAGIVSADLRRLALDLALPVRRRRRRLLLLDSIDLLPLPPAFRSARPASVRSTGCSRKRNRSVSSSMRPIRSSKSVERFLLVLDQRIALSIAAQADAFLEVVHGEKVILPVRVHDLQHDHALVIPHRRLTPITASFCVVFLVGLVDQRFFEFLRAQG